MITFCKGITLGKKTKNSFRYGWGYYVCLIGGIFGFNMIFDFGDSLLAAGLESGVGAALGIGAFYIGKYFNLPGCYINVGENPRDEQKQ